MFIYLTSSTIFCISIQFNFSRGIPAIWLLHVESAGLNQTNIYIAEKITWNPEEQLKLGHH